ncbi:hypothetical protein HELRODRAFT_189560 [Helobdella robusta]|uniref:Farnesoic acid O-methyl transferase domain-containing protein n=1 Tax=Helobdella robusta TaxID=6412 RepID=T1FR56_HELRO|nr:hypothetical protein HELRODRAFT_189560 [Helobdella robusta]ESN92668.1 hypothetical protein HELRODRAFT_189560 [Helobdella robusta]
MISDDVFDEVTKNRIITLASYRKGQLLVVRLERLTPKQAAKYDDDDNDKNGSGSGGDSGGVGGRGVDNDRKKGVMYQGREGIFRGVLVLNDRQKPHPKVCKPHVMTSFNAYVVDTSQPGEFLERPQKKEKRTLKFWLYRRTISTCNEDNNNSNNNNNDNNNNICDISTTKTKNNSLASNIDNISNKNNNNDISYNDDEIDKITTCAGFIRLLIEPDTFPVDSVGFLKKALLLMRQHAKLKRVDLEFQTEPDEVKEEPTEIPLIENFITVLTPAAYDYQYLPEVPVSRKSMICFRLKAAADGHVALSYVYGDTDRRTYEVVLGAHGNRKSLIRYGGKGEVMVERLTPSILDSAELRPFWVSWNVNCVRVGRGLEVDKDLIMEWTNIPLHQHHLVNLVSVSTGPASEGRWEFVDSIRDDERIKRIKTAEDPEVLGVVLEEDEDHGEVGRCFPVFTYYVPASQTEHDKVEQHVGSGSLLEEHTNWRAKLKLVPCLPRLNQTNAPTVAIVTTSYAEKIAVDAMFDEKISYFIKGENEENSIFTIGRMANRVVVATKLGNFSPETGCNEKHAKTVAKLIASLPSIRYLYLVSVGGAVPHYTNFEQHCKRGDVVFSGPRPTDGAFYVVCPEVDDVEPEVDPTGNSAFFPTSCWNSGDDGFDSLQKRAAILVDGFNNNRKYEKWRKWDSFVESAQQKLVATDERFLRPSQKTDKLQAQLDIRQPPIFVSHPPCPANNVRRENQASLKIGAIASGDCVSRHHLYRRIFANQNRIAAYDCGLDKIVQAIVDSRLGGNNMEIVLGMCDYSDGQVGKSWQPYAALVAAAACKVLLVDV